MTSSPQNGAKMTTLEQTYVESYGNVIAAVCSVDNYVTSAHRRQLDSLERSLGEDRCQSLREVARRHMGF